MKWWAFNVQNLLVMRNRLPPNPKPSSAALKYVLLVAVRIVWIAAPLLSFSFPILSDRLAWAYLACLVALFFLFLRALLRRRWKERAILCAIFGVVPLLPYYSSELSFRWLYVHAFRVHVAPVKGLPDPMQIASVCREWRGAKARQVPRALMQEETLRRPGFL